MDCASSARRSSWKMRRGCSGLGLMSSIATLSEDSRGSAGVWGTGAGGGVWVRVGRSAPIPLPSALRGCSVLFMVEDLFGEFNIAFGPLGSGVIGQDGFAKAGRFGQADAAGDDGAEDFILEEFTEIGGHLTGEVRSVIEHREQNAFGRQWLLEGFPN